MSWINALLSNLNYGTILFLMLLESTVIPVPSETGIKNPRPDPAGRVRFIPARS